MRILAPPFELVEHDSSTFERRVFAIPGYGTATYAEVKVYLKERGAKILDPSVMPIQRKNTARIPSQLAGNQPIMRRNTPDDGWR